LTLETFWPYLLTRFCSKVAREQYFKIHSNISLGSNIVIVYLQKSSFLLGFR